MGVNGLWTVIQPCARPTNLATLNRKRLAVDASIWIYQFLKAVRDKEGNALRNSHVVGFFRRICKLLWFGIQPVFVFDGGAPALKRQTITKRMRRREGRREDAVRTAGKLLAVQMQRVAEEEGEKRRKRLELEQQQQQQGIQHRTEDDDALEELPDVDKLVYVDELGMSEKERQKSRRFYKQDAYHLPELDSNIANMGKPEDPRIMSIEELEEYARQFNSGEDINLYDFSKIDFEGEFFKSLPPADRYNILNAARLRSRLRMGLSKEQLDTMFPDRMAFSRFQIERVKERNHLTQRLMKEAGMTGTDLTLGVNGRVAGEKDREYILVKNDGAEGGWALGVVSKEKDRGEIHKPIDVDALDFQYQAKEEDEEEVEDDGDFEDIPIEGLNRLPKNSPRAAREYIPHRNRVDVALEDENDDSLFVPQDASRIVDDLFDPDPDQNLLDDEDEDINRAIALSLKTQHEVVSPSGEEEEEEAEFEDVPAPEWTQKAAEQSRPITSATGNMIAHMVNNRANRAVPKRKARDADSDSDDDFQSALAKARKKKKASAPRPQLAPSVPNVKNPFGGPLPFEKLDWKSSIFAKMPEKRENKPAAASEDPHLEPQSEDELAGGFERERERERDVDEDGDEDEDKGPRPIPPWMIQEDADIREMMKAQRENEVEINEADREAALQEEARLRKDAIIEIQSSDDESDVEFIDAPAAPAAPPKEPAPLDEARDVPRLSPATLTRVSPPVPDDENQVEDTRHADAVQEQVAAEAQTLDESITRPEVASRNSSPEPDFEEIEILEPPEDKPTEKAVTREPSPESTFEPVAEPPQQLHALEAPEASVAVAANENDDIFGADAFDDEFSDPEEEELLAQMAEEASEHARFASQLNHKPERENQEAYERELKALRTQQKKDRRDADEVTQIMVTECQALLRLFGIPYVTAPMEAEAQCAELVCLGLVDGIVTDDSDTFLFGGTRVYKNMFNSNKFVECYLLSDLERDLSLSRDRLAALAQLLGSDYAEGLPGVGPVTAVEILSEFPGPDGLARFRDWWDDVQLRGRPRDHAEDAASAFRRKFRRSQAAKLFLPTGFPSPAVDDAYMRPEVDASPEPFQWGVPDVEGLREFLMATIGWSRERTDDVLVPVVRDMNRRAVEGTQSNITRYFEGGVGVGARLPQQPGPANGSAASGGSGGGGGGRGGEAYAPRRKAPKTSKRMAEAVSKLREKKKNNNNVVSDGVIAEEGGGEEAADDGNGNRDDANDDDDFVDEDGVQEKTTAGRRNGKGKGEGKAKATSRRDTAKGKGKAS
ncbi:putative dna excision repair protein rad2 protein [Eutypa lata UCREL1]|uniref:Putative dna excision repair protein rad2 protein n=1 Tax=Eutypa lata (strain UCR-EL1) TaxID=1287681 RepID=M7TT02_EUTLA|nr:putative dna excision repair protein rad2 protein [Eutypa lata UCREL1]